MERNKNLADQEGGYHGSGLEGHQTSTQFSPLPAEKLLSPESPKSWNLQKNDESTHSSIATTPTAKSIADKVSTAFRSRDEHKNNEAPDNLFSELI